MLTAGTKLGPYEILSALGAGGMGEVYRARDTKLGREVAVKILPAAFTNDLERLARFRREAQVLAALNHPHIGAIYGLDEANGQQVLVLELVDGEGLDRRIARGPIPVDEALRIAKQIAEALEAAHEKGIIHRDLKPANIALTNDGNVKVLDFGLAKVTEAAGGTSIDLADSPTMTSPAMMTGMGMILGTAAYMSPEQAKGRPAEKRSDVWAFGCVLYEMLTAKRAFEGEDVSDTLAFIITKEPYWDALPAGTPRPIRTLLRRCLEKDRKERLPDIAMARLEIKDALTAPAAEASLSGRRPRWSRALPWAVASLLLVAFGLLSFIRFRDALPVAPAETRLDINTPPTTNAESLALAPDGRKMVFTGTADSQSRLWLRSLDSVSTSPLRGTEGAVYPFWSPDSRSIAFFADGKLKRMDLDSGSVKTLANSPTTRGGAWNRDDVILFSGGTQPLVRISATTDGQPVQVTRFEGQQSNHCFPQFLPDGRHFLYYAIGAADTNGVYVGQLDGSKPRRLLDADAAAVYASSGHLLFVREGTLLAQRFDATRLEVTGTPFPVAQQVGVSPRPAQPVAAVSASAAGPIAYRTGSAGGGQRQFVWFDRSGRELGKVGEPDSAQSLDPSMSPDGRRIALWRRVDGNTDVWLLELARGVRSRFTVDASSDNYPIWSPDGSRIVFHSNRKTGVFDLYQKPASGAGSEELLLESPLPKTPLDWSSDGRFLLYRISDPKTGINLWALPLEGDRKPFPVGQTNFHTANGQFSPDGKWVAYQSDESGRFEIHIQAFPGPGGKVQVSTGGGAQVRWRHDGKEVFYIALDDRLMVVPLQFASNGQTVDPGAPVPLFTTHIGGAVPDVYNRPQYMVSPDGQRFLMNTIIGEPMTSPITVIQNWRPRN